MFHRSVDGSVLRLNFAGMGPLRLSAGAYFLCVALLTAFGIGIAMMLRPAFAHSVQSILGLDREPQVSPGSFYAVRVAPVLEEHCVGCHGPRRQKGDLRVDSLSAVTRGGRRGSVVAPGNPKESELYVRMTLPSEDDKAMPPAGKTVLSADEVTVIRLWILSGASGALPVTAIKSAPNPIRKVVLPELDEAAVLNARAGLARQVEEWQRRFPTVLAYESRGSADLQLNAALLGPAFDDAVLETLEPFRNRIVWADLSNTAITDKSAASISRWIQLRTLRLANTRMGDATVRALRRLGALQVVTITGTAVSEDSVKMLRNEGVTVYDGTVE